MSAGPSSLPKALRHDNPRSGEGRKDQRGPRRRAPGDLAPTVSRPAFRLATILVIDLILDLAKNVRRNVLRNVLRVQREHPNLALSSPQLANDPESAAFAAPSKAPPKLAHSARAGNYRAGWRVGD